MVAIYHDQGHGPVKVMGPEAGVNIAVGLPVIRTSVDHGTAVDIAGKGNADEGSMLEALRQAIGLAVRHTGSGGDACVHQHAFHPLPSAMTMSKTEKRRQTIVGIVSGGDANAEALSRHFSVSESMIRRDLAELALDGRIVRTYGGAALLRGQGHESSLDERMHLRSGHGP